MRSEELAALEAVGDVLDRIEARIGHLEEVAAINRERLETIMTNQAALDADLKALGEAVGRLVTAYQSASAKASAAGVDLSAEDAQVKQLEEQISSALTPAAATTDTPSGSAGDAAGSGGSPPGTDSSAASASASTGAAGTTDSWSGAAGTAGSSSAGGTGAAAASDTSSGTAGAQQGSGDSQAPSETGTAADGSQPASLPSGAVPGASAGVG